MCDVYSCGLDGVIVGPKRVRKQNIIVFTEDFIRQRSHEHSRKTNGPPGIGLWEGVGRSEINYLPHFIHRKSASNNF